MIQWLLKVTITSCILYLNQLQLCSQILQQIFDKKIDRSSHKINKMFSELVPNQIQMKNKSIVVPYCEGQNESNQLCQSPLCQSENIFICENQNCKCQQSHQFCLKVSLKTLIKIVSKKRRNSDNCISKQVEKVAQQLIDLVSDTRDAILIKLDYLGLSESQRDFLYNMEQKNFDRIKSNTIHEICANIHKSMDLHLQNASEYIENWWKKASVQTHKLMKSFETVVSVKALKRKAIIREIQSKIVQQQQLLNLAQLFGQRKIEEFKLLYRASDCNSSIPQFHNKCDNIPNTITFALTPHNKVIGAFSKLPWDKDKNGKYESDDSFQTFIFSLTDNKKFVQPSAQNTIHHYASWGPRFGTDGSCDFAIGSDCYSNIGNLFKLPPSENDLQSCKNNFVGGGVKGSTRWKAKNWEVFEVVFYN